MAKSSLPVPNALLALYRMPGLRCCSAECIAMCAWRTCSHTVLRCSADTCLLVPIFADHVGGAARCHAVRVVRAGLPLRPRRPSGHSREQELVTGRDCKKRGRWHGRSSSQEVEVCLVHVMCYTCVGAPLQASRVSLSHAYGLRASSEHAGRTKTYTYVTVCMLYVICLRALIYQRHIRTRS